MSSVSRVKTDSAANQSSVTTHSVHELGPIPGAAEALGIDPHGYRIWIRMLGRLRVYIDYREIAPSEWSYPKVRSLFRMLLMHEQSLPVDTVLEAIWPTLPPDRARQNFSVALHHLRAALEPDRTRYHNSRLLIYRDQQVRFNHRMALTDRGLFLKLSKEAERLGSDHPDYHGLLEHMVALYAGPLYEDEPYQDWCNRERDRLEELYLMTREELCSHTHETGQYSTCLRHCEEVLAVDPLREPVHYIMLKAYRAMGNRAKALSHYHRLRDLLDEELGVEPSTKIKKLYTEILED